MLQSLSSRIVALVAVVMAALLALAWLLLDASAETRDGFRWVAHSATVIEVMERSLGDLREAESGQRGFILTHDPAFAAVTDERLAGSKRGMAHVAWLTSDNPLQHGRAMEIQALIEQRGILLQKALGTARSGKFDEAGKMIAKGHGRDLMTAVSLRSENFLDEEHALQASRTAAADARLARVRLLAVAGIAIISLLVVIVAATIVWGIRRPVGIMRSAMTALGRGEQDMRIDVDMGSSEFAGLARGYNGMAAQLQAAVADQGRSARELQVAVDKLSHNGAVLKERGEVIELLGGMAHRMQAARTDEELSQVIRVFVPRVLPGSSGALYAHNNSRNLLIPVAGWGGVTPLHGGFAPDQCWALRRGQSHFLAEPGTDIVCGHVHDEDRIYHCEPLLAGGEVIGTLYLEGVVDAESRFRLAVMAENIASALVNHRLQRGLREQTIRDPLTGLFNRRYMEETLAIEIARAARSKTPLSVVMCDVDHFKRFNDEFGHDAGDLVLQAVAAEMRPRFRDGDVVCRYGGEEFTVIAPGATGEALRTRVELVRQAITEISLRQGGRTLGSASMSFGIASWHDGMDRDGTNLVQAADAALYRAKRDGRNRTVLTLLEAA